MNYPVGNESSNFFSASAISASRPEGRFSSQSSNCPSSNVRLFTITSLIPFLSSIPRFFSRPCSSVATPVYRCWRASLKKGHAVLYKPSNLSPATCLTWSSHANSCHTLNTSRGSPNPIHSRFTPSDARRASFRASPRSWRKTAINDALVHFSALSNVRREIRLPWNMATTIMNTRRTFNAANRKTSCSRQKPNMPRFYSLHRPQSTEMAR